MTLVSSVANHFRAALTNPALSRINCMRQAAPAQARAKKKRMREMYLVPGKTTATTRMGAKTQLRHPREEAVTLEQSFNEQSKKAQKEERRL